jgi:hypothetical protein
VPGSLIAADPEGQVETVVYGFPSLEGRKGRISADNSFQLMGLIQWHDLLGSQSGGLRDYLPRRFRAARRTEDSDGLASSTSSVLLQTNSKG